eukprot:343621-Prymnesium_polylepis.2
MISVSVGCPLKRTVGSYSSRCRARVASVARSGGGRGTRAAGSGERGARSGRDDKSVRKAGTRREIERTSIR